ncbi:MAG TPA: hypothetical protein VMW11_09310 [Candidatus Dormibacteraeota bacterium]|nr:hypothetical protein [Candidatus Dormibacteraeota bacterium]
MTPLSRFRHLRIAGFALGAAAVAGAAVLVTASAAGFTLGFRPASATQPQAADTAVNLSQASIASTVCNDFISHLSSDLGKSQSQVNAAVQKAIGETLADEVKNKHLTQAQADAIKQKLASQPPCNLASGLGSRPGAAAAPRAGAYLQQLLTAAASALGISAAQLRTDIAGGMSLSQIAAAQKPPVTEAQFRTKLIAQLTPLLDAAVKNQKLTSAQEQAILQRLQAGPIPFWTTPPRRPKAAAPSAPATTTTT